jgi:hypothetical protein
MPGNQEPLLAHRLLNCIQKDFHASKISPVQGALKHGR